MSPPTTWQTSMVLPFISTATCMDSKYCRNFARSQDVKYVLFCAYASMIVCVFFRGCCVWVQPEEVLCMVIIVSPRLALRHRAIDVFSRPHIRISPFPGTG
jgi:hypothetical protein